MRLLAVTHAFKKWFLTVCVSANVKEYMPAKKNGGKL